MYFYFKIILAMYRCFYGGDLKFSLIYTDNCIIHKKYFLVNIYILMISLHHSLLLSSAETGLHPHLIYFVPISVHELR